MGKHCCLYMWIPQNRIQVNRREDEEMERVETQVLMCFNTTKILIFYELMKWVHYLIVHRVHSVFCTDLKKVSWSRWRYCRPQGVKLLYVPYFSKTVLFKCKILHLWELKAVTLSPRHEFICLATELILRYLTDMSRKVKHYSIQVNSIPVFGKSAGPLIYSSAGLITKNNCCVHNSNSVRVNETSVYYHIVLKWDTGKSEDL